MAGEAYPKRWPAGFVDNDISKYADAQFLNNAEAALLRLLGADPIDQGVQVWDAGLGRMKSIKLTNSQIDPAAAIDKSKLAALNIVDADISGAASIAKSKLNLNGAITNADISGAAAIDLSKLAATAWTAYTPTWTSAGTAPALLNGTLVGRYIQIGKTVFFTILLTAGTTTTFGSANAWIFSLPVTANANAVISGSARYIDAAPANFYAATPVINTNTTLAVMTPAQPAVFWNSANPVAGATGDIAQIAGSYEAA